MCRIEYKSKGCALGGMIIVTVDKVQGQEEAGRPLSADAGDTQTGRERRPRTTAPDLEATPMNRPTAGTEDMRVGAFGEKNSG